MFWLGQSLDAAAFSALPARSVPDAALLVMQLDLKVDVLVINTGLAGASDFIAALYRSQRNTKVVVILSDDQQTMHIPGVNAAHLKPTILDEAARTEWVHCIEQVLMNHSVMSSSR